jgi:hypothetical protein
LAFFVAGVVPDLFKLDRCHGPNRLDDLPKWVV